MNALAGGTKAITPTTVGFSTTNMSGRFGYVMVVAQ